MRLRPSAFLAAASSLVLACAAPRAVPPAAAAAAAATPAAAAPLELVESHPVETTLDNADLRDAHVVWPEMLARARTSVDVAQFYVSNAPGSRLEPVLAALEAAAARGVAVRVLADVKFQKTYPESLARLAARPGIAVRLLDLSAMGGVLHAKYFVVDGREAFVGSQNFDWRALEHIQELGLRVAEPQLVRPIAHAFAQDWARAGGESVPAPLPGPATAVEVAAAGGPVRVTPVFSPQGALPQEGSWDLPQLVALLDGARERARVQLLTYKASERGGGRWTELEDALKRAAARGVKVELLVADWGKRKGTIEGLQALHAPPGLTVRLVTIPQHSGGFVPFGRVVHAKYLVVDGRAGWLGTSNWERNYFYGSRNLGFVLEGAPLAARLDRFFEATWGSPYAADVDPKATYVAPDPSGGGQK